jgi:hypothetical protein
MKYTLLFMAFLGTIFSFQSCEKENMDDDNELTYDYHAHIHSPNMDAKHVGDTITIAVDFESHTGETIHHINVTIKNKTSDEVIYNMPTTAHIHETSGSYHFHDELILSDRNGVTGHSDWILEAKVWGHEAGEEEASATVEFHVHP